MVRASHFSAFFLGGIFTVAVWAAQVPDVPAWILEGCADVVCVMPAELFDGFRAGQSWYEPGTPTMCADQAAGQSGCIGADPDFRAWLELTRANGSRLVLVADSALYGPAGAVSLNVGYPDDDGIWPAWANGGVFAFGLPPVQLPVSVVPPADSQAWADWWSASYVDCLTSGACGPVTVDPHDHPFTIIMPDGSAFTGTTGPAQ